MTPPDKLGSETTATSRVACPCISGLKTRPEFLRAASARRQGAQGFLVQARNRNDVKTLIQVGFTASKKIGNAVKRNRAKRRLRALAREVLPAMGRAGWDYVLVARPGVTVDRIYADLRADLEGALAALHHTR